MPEIAPFKGIVYGPDLAGDAARLICPPYDAIPPAMQQELYESSDYNAVRLELPAEPDPYAASASRLREWLASGVLSQDGEPALYPCFQTFEDEHGVTRTRKGLFAALRLHDFADGEVLPHERTLSGPKADRLKMFRETGANISSIFGLYADSSRQVDEAISEFAEMHEPLIDATLQGGAQPHVAHHRSLVDCRRAVGARRAEGLYRRWPPPLRNRPRVPQRAGGGESRPHRARAV